VRKLGGALAVGVIGFMVAAPALAADDAARSAMEQRVRAEVPPDWQVRTRWRDNVLVTFLTPSARETFDVLHSPARKADLVKRLCPPAEDGSGAWSATGATSPSP
jgi:hypothetical protein